MSLYLAPSWYRLFLFLVYNFGKKVLEKRQKRRESNLPTRRFAKKIGTFQLPMRAIAFWLEQTAALKDYHSYHEEEKKNFPIIDFFHNKIVFTFTDANVSITPELQ